MERTAQNRPVAARSPAPPSPWEDKAALLERILRNPRVPSPPTLALQIFQKTGQADCSIGEISELLAHDPGLCGKILKTLNSALYGRSRPVTNMRQAVTMLGNRPLRSLVLGLALPVMQSGVEADAGLRRFWRRSVAGAVMARALAVRSKLPIPDDEMAAGLLCDLGMILLQQVFPEKYRPIWTGDAEILAEDQCEWEECRLGVHHAEVGAALLEQWRLPMEIVEPIRFHHHPERLPALVQQLTDRAFLLDMVTRLTELEEGCQIRVDLERILQSARERFGLDRADLEQFLGAVRPQIEAFSSILGVDIGACPNFDELLTSGCEELVRVSVEAATATNRDQECAQNGATLDHNIANSNSIPNRHSDAGSLTTGSRILQYEVVGVIGRGSMGIVVKAFDPGLARHVAIKLLAPELAGSETARRRFACEARFAAALRHEHVVAIHVVSEWDGMPLLVMEYVNGSSLEDLFAADKAFSVQEIARIGQQTALGLAAAHEARLIHRDIKPANILLEEGTGHVRVADFGLARALDEDFHLSQPGLLLGTPNFMSPEQVDGKALTAASDLFGLGSVLYTLCAGQLPFQAETMSGLLHAVVEKQPPPICVLNPAIPQGLARVVEKLHAKNPADRPPSAAAVAAALQPWTVSR